MLDLAATPQRSTTRNGPPSARQQEQPLSMLTTLVPNSGIQFIDFTIGEEVVAHTRRRFFEDGQDANSGPASTATEKGSAPAPGHGPSLHVASLADGAFYHPVTNAPCQPSQTYTINGIEALEAYKDGWLPLPFMRITGRDGADGADAPSAADLGLDDGPANWVRVYIARAGATGGYHVVLAIDTTVDATAAQQMRAYVSPSTDDLRSGAAFRFSDDVADVAWFATEAWVDEWLNESFAAGRRRKPNAVEPGADTGALEHLAHYLTLLAVLKEACDLPALRFMEPNAVGAYAESVPVDLALDIGSARTCALMHERHQRRERSSDRARDRQPSASPTSARITTTELSLRDLSRPWQSAGGVFSSRTEFARASFGNDALSRWSGRTHAFHWPSLVRVGPEAERLSREMSSSETVTGVSSPMHYVWDEKARNEVWRFAGNVPSSTRRNPIVAGAILAHLSEAGDVLDVRDGRTTTTKPRFSRSSLTTFFVTELLLHAVSTINSPSHRERSPRSGIPRRLDRILVTTPAGMAESEQIILRRRIEGAVRLVWKVMGWLATSAQPAPLAPPEPSVVLVADSATSTQITYLRNEIAHKFRGRADSYFAMMGRQRAGFTGARTLRLATLDVGAATTGLSIATYELTTASTLACTRQLVDGFGIGLDDVTKALGEQIVVPAIEQRLLDCKLGNAHRFVDALVGSDDRRRPAWVGDLGRRFTAELVMPAAAALVRLLEQPAPGGSEATTELSMRTLLASVGADAGTACELLDVLAADEGADGFAPLDTMVPFVHRELAEHARTALQPVLQSALRVITALDCDCVLLTGAGAALPLVMQSMLEGIPLRPDRIIALADYRMGPWFRYSDDTGRVRDPKRFAALGCLLQGGHAFGSSAPELVIHSLDHSRSRAFIGRLDAQGLLADDAVMFVTGEDGGERTRTLFVELPAHFGLRRTSLAAWPAQPLFTIELAERRTSRPPRLPLKITIEHIPPDRGRPVQLKLVSAFDADGNRLDSSEIGLHLKTRRFTDGHWLDTGRLETAGARS